MKENEPRPPTVTNWSSGQHCQGWDQGRALAPSFHRTPGLSLKASFSCLPPGPFQASPRPSAVSELDTAESCTPPICNEEPSFRAFSESC